MDVPSQWGISGRTKRRTSLGLVLALVAGLLTSVVLVGGEPAGAGPTSLFENCAPAAPLSIVGDSKLGGILTDASGGLGFGGPLPATVTVVPGVRPNGTFHVEVAVAFDADAFVAQALNRVVEPAIAQSGVDGAAALANSAALTMNLADFGAKISAPNDATYGTPTVSVSPGGPSASVGLDAGDVVVSLGDITGSAQQPSSASTAVPTSTPPFTVTVGADVTIGNLAMGTDIFVEDGGVSFSWTAASPSLAGLTLTAVDDVTRTAGVNGSFACTNPGHWLASLSVSKLAPFAYSAYFVERQYRDFVGRTYTQAEGDSAIARLNDTTTAAGFVTDMRRDTNAVDSDALTVVDPVTRLYFAYFGRVPDAGGFGYWVGRKRSGKRLVDISSDFAASSEFKAKYGTLTNRQFVTRLYTDVLGRTADAAGVSYWTGRLDRKASNRGTVMTGFSESSEYKRHKADAVDVAVTWISMLHVRPSTTDFDTWVANLAGSAEVGDLADHIFGSRAYAKTVER